ncbi:MAG: DUF1738 domain-containing protein [Hyphomicrobiaceae bacterium]|nr:DUF1738 domain-containing protein [Hyphomicrobiaceae bacterium]
MTTYPSSRRDMHADITNQLVAAIEAGPGQMTMPWRRGGGGLHLPVNADTGSNYQGINVISLWVAAESRGYRQPLWATYRQWAALGAQVRKGEKAAHVIFYREYEGKPDAEDADDNGKRRVARASAVFNADQVEGFTLPEPPEPLGPIARLENVDRFVRSTGARIVHGGDRACYQPSSDQIRMPDEGLFTGTQTMTRDEAYYAVLVHELIHWTGPQHRLGREMGKRFGDQAYVAEELVAEISAAFLCAELQITQDVRPDHASYLSNWMQLLKEDNRAIFTAAARAAEAVNWLKKQKAAQ